MDPINERGADELTPVRARAERLDSDTYHSGGCWGSVSAFGFSLVRTNGVWIGNSVIETEKTARTEGNARSGWVSKLLRATSRSRWLVILPSALAVFGLALALMSVRLRFTLPSILDDWEPATRPALSAQDFLRGFIDPTPLRFRPVYDVMTYAQWRTFGGPRNLLGPEAWHVLRIAAFVAGLSIVPALAALGLGRKLSPLALAGVALIPAAVVVATPGTAVDYTRYGPAEPVLFGASICGAALILAGLGHWLRDDHHVSRGSLALLFGGWTLWVIGVYQKEVSVSFAVAAPFVYWEFNRHWRATGAISDALWRNWRSHVVTIALLAPVLHMLAMSARVAGSAASIYGATSPESLSEWIKRLQEAAKVLWIYQDVWLHTGLWRWLAIATVVLLLVVWVTRLRFPALEAGLILTSLTVLVFEGIPLVPTSRYYLPSIALLSVAGALLISHFEWRSQTAMLFFLACIAVWFIPSARAQVQTWSSWEMDNERAIWRVAELTAHGCPVYMAGVGLEYSYALPRLVGMIERPRRRGCPDRAQAIVISQNPPSPEEGTLLNNALLDACAPPGYRDVGSTQNWLIRACDQLRTGQVFTDALRQDRFVPGVTPNERREMCLDHLPRARCVAPSAL